MRFRCHKVYLTRHSYPRYVIDATLAQRPCTSCNSSMDVSHGIPMPLATAPCWRPRRRAIYLDFHDLSRYNRHISLRATCLGPSDISRARATCVAPSDISRHRATYLAPSDMSRETSTYAHFRHMSLRRERHMSTFSDLCRYSATADVSSISRGGARRGS